MLFITQQLDYACEHATRAGTDAHATAGLGGFIQIDILILHMTVFHDHLSHNLTLSHATCQC